MATIAAFLALGLGGAWAATELGRNDVKSKHIKNRGVKTKDLADNAVTSPKVANASLLGEDFAPGQLPQGPQGEQGPPGATALGRGGPIQDTCNPSNTTFEPCATVDLTIPPGPGARVLVLGRVRAFPDVGATDGVGIGVCRLGTSTHGPVPDTTLFFAVTESEFITLAGITSPMGPGPTSFGIDCNQNDTDSTIDYDQASVQAVAISPE